MRKIREYNVIVSIDTKFENPVVSIVPEINRPDEGYEGRSVLDALFSAAESIENDLKESEPEGLERVE